MLWDYLKKTDARKNLASNALKGMSGILKTVCDVVGEGPRFLDFMRIAHLDFVHRKDDIFIVTYPRSGTTWMQMILYQLTTGGSMDFDHISQKAPFFERLIAIGAVDASDFEKLPSPRIFKSHLNYTQIPKGPGRYIYVIRNVFDVAVSYYHFYRSHLGFTGDFDAFFERFMKGDVQNGSWFDHVTGWKARRHDKNILIVTYEDLKDNLENGVKTIAAFLDIDLKKKDMERILERSAFSFMKSHEAKFDHITGMIWEKGYKKNTFLRKGKTGEGKSLLSPSQKLLLEKRLKDYNLPTI